jgi:transposase InsO family protein
MTDITEHPTREGKLYCAAVMDAFSRRTIGWSIDSRQDSTLVVNALDIAIRNRRPENGGIVHADHGASSRHGPSATRSVPPDSCLPLAASATDSTTR